jgi:hypothetical protein
MVTVPAATPVTTPVEAFTVAKAVFPLDQTPPVVVFANVIVEAAHTAVGPEIAGTTGKGFTVIDFVTVTGQLF